MKQREMKDSLSQHQRIGLHFWRWSHPKMGPLDNRLEAEVEGYTSKSNLVPFTVQEPPWRALRRNNCFLSAFQQSKCETQKVQWVKYYFLISFLRVVPKSTENSQILFMLMMEHFRFLWQLILNCLNGKRTRKVLTFYKNTVNFSSL